MCEPGFIRSLTSLLVPNLLFQFLNNFDENMFSHYIQASIICLKHVKENSRMEPAFKLKGLTVSVTWNVVASKTGKSYSKSILTYRKNNKIVQIARFYCLSVLLPKPRDQNVTFEIIKCDFQRKAVLMLASRLFSR